MGCQQLTRLWWNGEIPRKTQAIKSDSGKKNKKNGIDIYIYNKESEKFSIKISSGQPCFNGV